MKFSESLASHDRSTERYLQYAFQHMGLSAAVSVAKDRSIKILVGLENGETLKVLIYPPGKDRTKMSVSRVSNEGDLSQEILERKEFMGLYSKAILPKPFIKYTANELRAMTEMARIDHARFIDVLSSIPEIGLPVMVKKNKSGAYVVQEAAESPHPSP